MGKIIKVSGPLVVADGMADASMADVVRVGPQHLIGEILNMTGDRASIQVYEETSGLGPGAEVETTGAPLSVELGPGLIENIYDGIQRPLEEIVRRVGANITRGIQVPALDRERLWDFTPTAAVGAAVTGGDVRMAQYGLNRELAAVYARMARDKGYKGLFCVVSDPVDPLCRAVLQESDRGENGESDGGGLLPCQVRGFGLGVMHARALYFAGRDERFASYLTEGRAFGPHGEDLVLANSIEHYDDALSRELTDRVAHANLEMRKLGYKPYVAPALSSGALTLLALLRGQWHYASVYMDGIFMGCRQRLTPSGIEVERLTLPDALQKRLDTTAARLRAID